MKFFGQEVDLTEYVETLVIPKGGTDFVFKARPVGKEDYDFFETVCPAPIPQVFTLPGGAQEQGTEDAGYLAAVATYNENRAGFMFLRSLSATEGLTWERVEDDKPETWHLIEDELLDAGFVGNEVNLLFSLAITANGLDSDKIQKATALFLATAGNP